MPSKEDLLSDINIVVSMSSRQDMSLPSNARKVKTLLEQKKAMKTPVGIQYLQRLGQISERKNPSNCFICKNSRAVDGVLCYSCMSKYSHGKSFYGDDELDEDEDEYDYEVTVTKTPAIVNKLIKGVKTTAIIGIVLGSIQLLIGMLLGLASLYDASFFVSAGIFTAMGIINLINCIVTLSTAGRLRTNYKNITQRYSFKKVIGLYVWDVIIIFICFVSGGCLDYVLGGLTLAYVILDIVMIRSYVSSNRSKFNKL